MSINTIDAANQLLAENATLKAEVARLNEQLEAAQRERDELLHKDYLTWHAAACKFGERAEAAEAELKRRDEQEPVHFYREHNLYNGMTTSWVEVEAKDIDALRELTNPETAEIRTFYAAAPAAPAAEPEKVVKLPFKVETSNVPFAAYTWNAAIEECIKALDAAGVKWVEVE